MAEENQEKQQTDSKKQTDSIEAQEKHLLDSKNTLIKQLGEMIKSDTLDLKDKKSARSQRDKLIKGNNTLGSDLKKNVQDLKDGVTTTVDGFINETFGPLGGMVTSLTTGFFKRGKDQKDAKDLQVLELETAQDMVTEFKDGGTQDTLEKTAESSEETAENTKDTTQTLTSIDESSATTAEGMSIIVDGSVETVEKLGEIADAGDRQADAMESIDDKTLSLEDQRELARQKGKGGAVEGKDKMKTSEFEFGALGGGLTALSVALGAAGGLVAGPLFQLQHLPKIIDTFKMKTVPKLHNIFNKDMPKLITSTEKWGNQTKNVIRNAKGQFVKISDTTKFTQKGFAGSFDDLAAKVKDIGKSFKMLGAGDEVAGLGGKFATVAKTLATGVAGRALSVAGNPVFSVIAQGKDIFDVASAVTDDDVKTSVKNEDIGAIVGGFIGGAIGIIGGPAGVALGMGLGNMAGEFIGQAMDDPEITGAIKKVEENIKAERTGLKEEIATLGTEIDTATKANNAEILKFQEEIAAAKAAGNAAEAAELTRQLEERKTANAAKIQALTDEKNARIARDEQLAAEQAKMDKELTPLKEELAAIAAKADEINAEKQKLERQIALAEERGDSAMVARLTDRVTQLDEEFDAEDKKYQETTKKLREKASEVSGALAEQSNSFFDKFVTEGGFFGNLLGGVSQVATLWGGEGLGMEGEAKSKYLSEQIRKIEGSIAEQEALIKSGDDFDWKLTNRKLIIRKLQREKERLGKVESEAGLARGGFIVTRPSYLPSSGVVVGEHGTYSGRGAADGGFQAPVPIDGGTEAVFPTTGARGQGIMEDMGKNIAGSVMNEFARERISLRGDAGGGGSQTVIDNSTQPIVTNNTIINSPEPTGPMLPGAGRDTAVSHFRHVA